MILSDRTIREELGVGRIVIDPLDESCIQPSSVDLRLDRLFRVFLNHTMPVIDVKQDLEDLTRLVEIDDGQAFILHPGEFVLGSTYERVSLPDDLVGRIEGKALALDTEVPTPSGWRLMGDLRVGDEVFGLNGLPVPIVAVTPPLSNRPCRELVFSDSTTIVADILHQWLTRTKEESRRGLPGSVRTTEQIEGTLRCGRHEYTHRVPCCGGIAYRVGGAGRARDRATGGYSGSGSLSGVLCNTGVFGDEHMPAEYLQGDVEQAQALLPRKHDRQKRTGWFEWGRSIVAVREVPSVPVRCIQVGSSDGLFLVSRSFIPTHNSSLGRLGLLIHSTAGFIDAGFSGHITLELSNVANLPITLYPGMKIGQVSFLRMTTPADVPYGSSRVGSKYQGQRGPTPSRYWENFRE
jgi:deoxycytidine triphosphate deaminase